MDLLNGGESIDVNIERAHIVMFEGFMRIVLDERSALSVASTKVFLCVLLCSVCSEFK